MGQSLCITSEFHYELNQFTGFDHCGNRQTTDVCFTVHDIDNKIFTHCAAAVTPSNIICLLVVVGITIYCQNQKPQDNAFICSLSAEVKAAFYYCNTNFSLTPPWHVLSSQCYFILNILHQHQQIDKNCNCTGVHGSGLQHVSVIANGLLIMFAPVTGISP